MTPLARLERLLPELHALGPDGAWLAEALSAYLNRASLGLTFERALGLGPGWWEHRAIAERDCLVVELVERHGMSPGRLAAAAADYASRCWPRDRDLDEAPAHHQGRIEASLFRLHRLALAGAKWPLERRQIHRIVTSAGVAMSHRGAAA